MGIFNFNDAFNARKKYTRFRILVIGRANAGKTTLLKRVCNTAEEPCIYDEENNNLIDPTAGRGIHDINRPFVFASNPKFIFHDSPGFETGDESQTNQVRDFIAERAKSTEVNDQLHAIWYCFEPNHVRLLLDSDKKFFEDGVAGNVPVIAIATKFDYLITQVFTEKMGLRKSRKEATKLLDDKLEAPLCKFKFPPKAYIRIEELQDDSGNHQEQVKELIQKTAESLDNLALKMLLVSVQQNNLELCIRYAIKYTLPLDEDMKLEDVVAKCLLWFGHAYSKGYDYGKTEDEKNRNEYAHWDHAIAAAAAYHVVDVVNWNAAYVSVLAFSVKLAWPTVSFENVIRMCVDILLSQSLIMICLKKFNKTCTNVAKKVNIFYNESSVEMIIALLICAENSFWHRNSLLLDAFSDALQLYDSSGTRKKVESRLNQLGSYPHDSKGKHPVLQYFQSKSQEVRQGEYKTALTDLILAHCLAKPTTK